MNRHVFHGLSVTREQLNSAEHCRKMFAGCGFLLRDLLE